MDRAFILHLAAAASVERERERERAILADDFTSLQPVRHGIQQPTNLRTKI
jgi:hypothetical protein